MLSNEERERFADYCERNAKDYDALAEQAEKLPSMIPAAKHLKAKAVSYALVANDLRTAEVLGL